jgi:hypothetical protein
MSMFALVPLLSTGAARVLMGSYVPRDSLWGRAGPDEVMACFCSHFTGWVQETLGWRWIEWIAMCISSVLTIWLIVYGGQETRGSIILMHRAKRLRKETGDPRYRVASNPPNLRQLIWISCTRPLRKPLIGNAMLT